MEQVGMWVAMGLEGQGPSPEPSGLDWGWGPSGDSRHFCPGCGAIPRDMGPEQVSIVLAESSSSGR